jgi:integrase
LEVSGANLKGAQKRRYLLDGGGLYLVLTLKTGVGAAKGKKSSDRVTKSWVFRYRSRVTGKPMELGLGSLLDVSLAKAREKAAAFRDMLDAGRDPRIEVLTKQMTIKVEAAKAMTFDEAAASCIKDKRAGWKNEKHAAQWENTLATYASPIIGALPVASIDLALVRKVLDPIWTTKNETASRVRQRMEAVLGWATVSGYRRGDNPARWKNHLDHVLAATSKVKKVENHPALAYSRLGTFMEALREQSGTAALALEFAILTATRSGEVLSAAPGEFNIQKALWTIPAERMKAKKEHTVPLSPRAVAIVQALEQPEASYLFPGGKKGEPLSDAAMLALIKRMDAKATKNAGGGWKDDKGRRIVPHGFRSTFRDWAGECSNFPREVIENALAHQLKDKAEAAYSRGTQLAKRKALMDAWERFCSTPSTQAVENVIPIRKTL